MYLTGDLGWIRIRNSSLVVLISENTPLFIFRLKFMFREFVL